MKGFGDTAPGGRLVIGLDLDGVCADYTAGFRPYAAKHLGVGDNDLADPAVYDMVKAWGFADFADFRAAHKAGVEHGMLASLPVIDGAPEALQSLSEAGAHIRVVSHRLFLGGTHRETVAQTAEWLDNNSIPYMSLCFTGLKDSVGADVYIEDAPGNIESLRRQNIPVIVADQLYNRQVPGPRMTDWSQAFDLVSGILPGLGEP
ncbi:hypothetical protein ACFSSC_00995 [Corynebacterium mendelii]|uniref:5'-nucleotidase n=1 Tax=Corynebacterium mendelii TaxID=2765362 RepID=A0A939E113_9CORY|nr:hypothetical protein [Corynebacterium mendelii]MBN9643863.1 hypothetical protein [Corynebacterium mendelii]